jgi:hypothetical protein
VFFPQYGIVIVAFTSLLGFFLKLEPSLGEPRKCLSLASRRRGGEEEKRHRKGTMSDSSLSIATNVKKDLPAALEQYSWYWSLCSNQHCTYHLLVYYEEAAILE